MLLPLTLILYVDSLKSVTNPRHRRRRKKKIRAGSLSFDQCRLMRTLVDKSGFQKVLSTVLCLRVDRFWHHGHQVNTFSVPLWLPYFPLFFINLFFCRRKWYSDNLSVKTNLLLDKESQWPSYNHIFYFTTHFNVEMVKEKCQAFVSNLVLLLVTWTPFYFQSKPQMSLGFLGQKGSCLSLISGFYV